MTKRRSRLFSATFWVRATCANWRKRAGLSLNRRSRPFAHFLRDERGSYLVLMAIALPALIGIAGLGTEAGYWLYYHRVVQSAADNAAYSAATALAINSAATSSDLTLQAKAIAANDYGLVDGTNGVTVTMNEPPVGTCYPSSKYIGAHPGVIEVVITKSLSPLFSSIWQSSDVNICGRAVARVSGGGDCILATGTTGTVISTTRNNLNIDLNGCGLFSDSTASDSVAINGNNDAITADFLGTVGGASITGNANTKASFTTGDPPQADPYATEAASWPTSQSPAPTAPTLPTVVTTCPTCTNQTPPTCSKAAPTMTLAGGTYAFNGSSFNKCTTVNLTGGNYVLSGFNASGLTVNIQAASNIIVTSGNLNTGTVVFSGGNYSIYVAAGGWSMGSTTFGGGNYNIKVVGGDWTTSGTTTFGNGNYTIDVTKVAGTGGNWNVAGTTTFGTGTYNVTLDSLWTIGGATTNFGAGTYLVKAGGGWTISNATTFGNGNFNITITGNWTISSATTLGSGNYTFALTGDLITSGNFGMGSGTYSGSMTNWTITGTTTTIGNGIYYMSGNFNINGNGNETVTANSATMVLTGTSSIINYTSNNSTLTLTPPTSGWNAGIAVWEPNSTVSSPNGNQLAAGNNSVATITGVFYAPHADVELLGNTGTAPVCTQFVVKSIEFGGNSINLNGNCSLVPGVKTFGQIIAMVE
jgi:Flp pilus assembly protein TadG